MIRAIIVCLLLGGCASMTEGDCRAGNWYALGERDAMAGLRPRIDQYADQCGRFAVRPAEGNYMDGWQVGYTEWNRRTSGSRL
jgi:hypothetical protein